MSQNIFESESGFVQNNVALQNQGNYKYKYKYCFPVYSIQSYQSFFLQIQSRWEYFTKTSLRHGLKFHAHWFPMRIMKNAAHGSTSPMVLCFWTRFNLINLAKHFSNTIDAMADRLANILVGLQTHADAAPKRHVRQTVFLKHCKDPSPPCWFGICWCWILF